jgi:hypothetical protein
MLQERSASQAVRLISAISIRYPSWTQFQGNTLLFHVNEWKVSMSKGRRFFDGRIDSDPVRVPNLSYFHGILPNGGTNCLRDSSTMLGA